MGLNFKLLGIALTIGLLCDAANGQNGSGPDKSPSEPTVAESAPQQMEFFIQDKIFLIDLPVWWDSVEVAYPDGLAEKDFCNFVRLECGKDTGNSATWKQAFKLWVERELHDDEPFPVYPAHCLESGGHHLAAAKIFSELQLLARFTKKQPWYETYLAYSAGKAYFQGGQEALAEIWFDRASQGVDSGDSAIKYYANLSSENLNAIRGGMTPHGLRKWRRD